MKRTILFFYTVCLCFSLSSPAEAQRTARGAAPRSVQQHAVKEYKAGETYSLDDIVKLNTEGNQLTAELLKSKEGAESKSASVEVKIKISGKLQVLAFTFGRVNSDITLLAGQKRIAASTAEFTDEVVATASTPALVSRFRTSADTGTLVLDTNEHPLVLEFDIPSELTAAPKQIEMKNVGVGETKYSLIVELKQGKDSSATQRPGRATPAEPEQKIEKETPESAPSSRQKLEYDGTWNGTTSQDRKIAFTIKANAVVWFQLEYSIPSNGCFPVPILNNSFEVDYSSSTAKPKINGKTFLVERTQTSGGMNAAPIMVLNGKFDTESSASGDLQVVAMTRPGEGRLCQARAEATWKAKKGESSQPAQPEKPTSPNGDSAGRIEGMLVNADTQKPLPNVEIELSRADEGVPKNEKEVGKIKTDEKGQYSFSGLRPGKYLMSITVKYFREEDRPCRPVGWFVISSRTADGGFVQIAMSNEITLSANQVSKMNLDLKCN